MAAVVSHDELHLTGLRVDLLDQEAVIARVFLGKGAIVIVYPADSAIYADCRSVQNVDICLGIGSLSLPKE